MWGLEDDWSLFTSISSTTGSLILLWAPIWATLFKPFRIDSGVGNWQNRSLTLHGPFFQFILIFSQLPFHRHPWSEPAPLHHLQHQSAWQSHSALPAVIKVMEIHWIIVQCPVIPWCHPWYLQASDSVLQTCWSSADPEGFKKSCSNRGPKQY